MNPEKMTNDELAAWCAGSFPDFCRYALGYHDLNSIHEDICLTLQFDPHQSKMFLMPRNTFKSSVITCGWSLFSLKKNPDMRILIYSDSAMKAQGFLTDIKNHIEGKAAHSRFRDLYGDWTVNARTGVWNSQQITVAVRSQSRKEPSLDTAGIETSRVGMHYDLIIFDDIVTDLNTTTKAQMDKVYECYQKSLSLLKPGGEIVIVGTRWSFGDAHGRIVDENKERNTFKILIHPAYVLENGLKKYLFADCGENSLTPEFLEDKRRRLGTGLFSCLYLNNPASDESAVFKAENFRFFQNITTEQLYKTCTIDPAGEGEDFTAMVVCGTDHGGRTYVLDLINEHLLPKQIVDNMIRLYYKWKFVRLGVETNTFKNMLEDELRKARDEQEGNPNFNGFSIETFTAGGRGGESKHQRILALQPIHERQALRFRGDGVESAPRVYAELIDQMLKYTYDGAKTPHDDLIDALAYQVKLIRNGGLINEDGPKPGSLAHYEKELYEKTMRLNRHLPRMYRKKMEMHFQ